MKQKEEPQRKDTDMLTRLSEHLWVYRDCINIGIIKNGNKALLIDFGAGKVLKETPALGIKKIDTIMFTHHHRDQACGVRLIDENETKIGVPEAERSWFEDVARYWNAAEHRWHLYNFHPHHLMLAEPVRVDVTYADGDMVEWGSACISVVSTPGHTDGSVSYVVDVDGQRNVFCGDLLYGEGQLWELYSLQKGVVTKDYHGFLGAREQLVSSLRKIQKLRPSRLVPSHGTIITEPDSAIETLVTRLKSCYDTYASISALRFYFPELFADYVNGKDVMPIRRGKPVPEFLRHFETTWILISQDRSAFVMDCGSPSVIEEVQKLQADGTINRVEGLWITHYHDDHVDAAPAFRQAFSCPIIADIHVADIIENPLAWRLPCISPVQVPVDRRTGNGETWRWHEFKMTAYHFPGQTYYHGGLLVEGRGLRMFFAGDSFTVAGIDDYCCGNRNFLGKGIGFDHCITLLEKLKPNLIFNCHVDQAFDFTPEQYRFVHANLSKREKQYRELLAWDNPNYGIDEHWIRCFPYEQHVTAGSTVRLQVVITNHSTEPRCATCRAVFPDAWGPVAADFARIIVPPKREGAVSLRWRVPRNVQQGRYVVPVDVIYGDRFLPQIAEAIIQVVK